MFNIFSMDNRRFSVTADELRTECLRRKYCELLSQPEVFPSEENWEFIIANRLEGLGDRLYRKYLVSHVLDEDKRCDYHLLAIKYFPRYLSCVDRDYALDIVYSDPYSDRDAFVGLVYSCQLFDCGHVSRLIEDGHPDLAADLLGAFQPEYDGDDIDAMQFLLAGFDNLPSLGSIEIHKGIFKSERRYLCPDGHSNPQDVIYCQHEHCGKDINGLTETQRDEIEKFAERIQVLRDMLD